MRGAYFGYMNAEIVKILKNFGQAKLNEPMSKHTTFKIGGPVDVFLTVTETEKVVEALQYLDGEGIPYFILGGGSNMLVRDEGFHGVVLNIHTNQIHIEGDRVIADAGCTTVEVARKSIQAGLIGFEWGVGVPGTIGGAVRGNAGAMGMEMKDNLEKVEVYRNGEVEELNTNDCHFGYRESVFKQEGIVLRVHLKLSFGDGQAAMKKALENLQYRNKTQPQGFASTGCIFKNFEIGSQTLALENIPEEFLKKGKISAGWLIEQVGMKGKQVGKAKVSEVHGNFIVNLGGATAEDVLALVDEIKGRVYDTFRIEIKEEIQII